MIRPPGPPIRASQGDTQFDNGFWSIVLGDPGHLRLGRVRFQVQALCHIETEQIVIRPSSREVTLSTGLLTRIVETADHPIGLSLRITYDLHRSENVHIYARLEAREPVQLTNVVLPQLVLEDAAKLSGAGVSTDLGPDEQLLRLREPWLHLDAPEPLGVLFKKTLWQANWNDIGATQYSLAGSLQVKTNGRALGLYEPGPIDLDHATSLDSAIVLSASSSDPDTTRERLFHRSAQELLYIPAEEWEHFLSREIETDWLGPPILGGCLQRPSDQLVPRNLGMDILAHRRFSWNNEDLSLWWMTGRSLYWDFAIKKGQALLERQNQHGGWFEGADFYGFPPQHHQHYNSYTSFVYLTDLLDVTGDERFAAAVLRSKEFWLTSPPPAISHSEDASDAWWYRWGGYINEFGYTDERHALNTHASVLMIFSLLWDRFGDAQAREGLENGAAAFQLALDQGLQRGNGQFLYSLSQIDPRLERPGDPPYIQDNLIPELESVYTVLSAFRLIVANRVLQRSRVADACSKALTYFWRDWQAGTAKTYRCYPVKTFGLAAGELDLRFAFALPTLLRQPDHWTTIYKGFSAWVAPHERKGLRVSADAPAGCVESVFLARRDNAFDFALVNVGPPRRNLEVTVSLDDDSAPTRAHLVNPGDGSATKLPSDEGDSAVSFQLPTLRSNAVAVIRMCGR